MDEIKVGMLGGDNHTPTQRVYSHQEMQDLKDWLSQWPKDVSMRVWIRDPRGNSGEPARIAFYPERDGKDYKAKAPGEPLPTIYYLILTNYKGLNKNVSTG